MQPQRPVSDSRENARQAARALRELPPPPTEAQALSESLIARIREAMAVADGRLRFDDYMAMCLYEPGLGYYSAGSRKFGEEGDFVTAPEISPLFSRALARQCAELLEELGEDAEILEFGAGRGVMAADILLELERIGRLPRRYAILDVSAELRERQRLTLAERAPGLLGRVVWLERLPEAGFRGVVLGNELLDAMPVRRFRCGENGVEELFVAEVDGRFALQPQPAEAGLRARLAPLCEGLPPGYMSELNLAAEGWVAELGGFLEAGAALLIDYGFPAHEYYHPERSGGTLMCHYRHRGHDDALIYPGLQDITAHVDFTAIADAALVADLQVLGFANQTNFLLANGITELAAEEEGDDRQRMAIAAQLKRLTMPGEMGELFKVIALGRGIERPLRGFMLRDERGRL